MVAILSGRESVKVFSIVCLYMYYHWRSNYQEDKEWDHINWFSPTSFLCL